MKIKTVISFLTIAALMLLLASCDAGSSSGFYSCKGDTLRFRYAENITMVEYGEYTKVEFRNPWDTIKVLQSFILLSTGKDKPQNFPNCSVIKVPLENIIVYTCVHNSLIEQLGVLDAVSGVCDSKYIRNIAIQGKITKGEIVDCGSSMTPNIEKIIHLKPNAILLSAFENSNDHNKVAQVGIPIIDCIDYMESSPLARAEWIRFFGRLFGKGETADSLFYEIEQKYLAIKALADNVDFRPLVLTDLIYGQSWHVPGGRSTIGTLIKDAGGLNPFSSYRKSGNVRLTPEEVLFLAKDADYWMIKYSENLPPTLDQLGKDNPIYTKFKAFQKGKVYGCDTENSTYFEDTPFRPHWLLAEFLSIFHPEIKCDETFPNYYHNLQ